MASPNDQHSVKLRLVGWSWGGLNNTNTPPSFYAEAETPPFTLQEFVFGLRYNQLPITRQAEITNFRRAPQPILQNEQRECPVCTDAKPLSSFPAIATTRSCKHVFDRICADCLSQSISEDLLTRAWDQGIRCPEENCGVLLNYDDVQRCCGDETTLSKYNTAAFRRAVDQFHGVDLPADHPSNSGKAHRFYWCPVAECDSGQIHDPVRKRTEMVVCHKCGWRFCGRHGGMNWHEGMICEEWDVVEREREEARKRREDEEGESVDAVKKVAKKCPGVNCGVPTVKNGGCDHMTCIKCRLNWCWRCGKEGWDERHWSGRCWKP